MFAHLFQIAFYNSELKIEIYIMDGTEHIKS